VLRCDVDVAPVTTKTGLHRSLAFFYIGLGDEFDAEKLQAYPPGTFSFYRVISHSLASPASTSPR